MRIKSAQVEEPLPKLLVVAGADTHYVGGPSHNLENDFHADNLTTRATKVFKGQGKIWDDVAEDLGIPYPREIKSAIGKLFKGS